MKLRRLLIAQIVLAIGLSGIYFLPKTYAIRESAIIMNLPSHVDGWQAAKLDVSQLEKESLADDTEHEKGQYHRKSIDQLGKFDLLSAFIVLSGHDMNNSIHRPERCLPAQGFVLQSSSEVTIDLGGGRSLDATRLRSYGEGKDGSQVPNLTYYWFVGANEITNSHYGRTLIDMKDRLFTGNNQRWAYMTVAAQFGDRGHPQLASRSEEETDKMIQTFIRSIFPHVHKEQLLNFPERP